MATAINDQIDFYHLKMLQSGEGPESDVGDMVSCEEGRSGGLLQHQDSENEYDEEEEEEESDMPQLIIR